MNIKELFRILGKYVDLPPLYQLDDEDDLESPFLDNLPDEVKEKFGNKNLYSTK